ncbi:hypothetical protein ABIE44_000410 [Marmoricola sp. OAE513]|uniref:hypothetical protein n=1 Tax=Marmoricola sp. OAE513 TaxID=2817894 RepID=UPI001AEB0AA9
MAPTDPFPRTGPTVLRRRTVLASGALGTAALLSGCALNNPFDSTKEPAAEVVQDLAPDVGLAVTAVGLLLATQEKVRLATSTFPGLGPKLAGLTALHQAHLEALQDAVPDDVDPAPAQAPPAAPASRPLAMKDVRTAEKALHDQLVGLALRAESGPFARLLATMTAGISQQLAVLG